MFHVGKFKACGYSQIAMDRLFSITHRFYEDGMLYVHLQSNSSSQMLGLLAVWYGGIVISMELHLRLSLVSLSPFPPLPVFRRAAIELLNASIYNR